jgi:hypothetical protein
LVRSALLHLFLVLGNGGVRALPLGGFFFLGSRGAVGLVPVTSFGFLFLDRVLTGPGVVALGHHFSLS